MAFKFFAWNVDQARREEAQPETTWDVRSPHVKSLIRSRNPDVMAIIELRDLVTSRESARAFLSDPLFAEYDVVHRRYCHSDITFSMALMVKHAKFYVGDVRVHSFVGDVQTDKIVMFVDIQDKSTCRWMTVGVTHFDLPEPIKWASVHILRNLMQQQPYPCFVYGDYNFFEDLEGVAHRKWMTDVADDMAFPLDNAAGTFIGFPHDGMKQTVVKPSRLDHVFTMRPNRFRLEKPATSPLLANYQLDNSSYATYTYPSDHLAIELEITLV